MSFASSNNATFAFTGSTTLDPESSVLRDYEIGYRLGEGAYGSVYSVTYTPSGERFALKILQKEFICCNDDYASVNPSSFSAHSLEKMTSGVDAVAPGNESSSIEKQIIREAMVMQNLDHPHVVKFYKFLNSTTAYYFIMELAEGGELFDLVISKKYFPEQQARNFFQQLISAIDYCHRNGVAHRDLKAENLLLASENGNRLIVCDFGFSSHYSKESINDCHFGEHDGAHYRSPFGTLHYTSPEALAASNERYYDDYVGCSFQGDDHENISAHIPFPIHRYNSHHSLSFDEGDDLGHNKLPQRSPRPSDGDGASYYSAAKLTVERGSFQGTGQASKKKDTTTLGSSFSQFNLKEGKNLKRVASDGSVTSDNLKSPVAVNESIDKKSPRSGKNKSGFSFKNLFSGTSPSNPTGTTSQSGVNNASFTDTLKPTPTGIVPYISSEEEIAEKRAELKRSGCKPEVKKEAHRGSVNESSVRLTTNSSNKASFSEKGKNRTAMVDEFQQDLWSAGVILFFMLTGRLPFDGRDDDETESLIAKAEISFSAEEAARISPAARALTASMLALEPSNRPTLENIIKSQWFRIDLDIRKDFPHREELYTYFADDADAPIFLDFSRDHHVTPEEEHVLKLAFDRIDTDGYGKLTRDQIRDMLTTLTGRMVESNDVTDLVKFFTGNESSTNVSFEEFYDAWVNRDLAHSKLRQQDQFQLPRIVSTHPDAIEPSVVRQLRNAFNKVDEAHTGVITKEQLERLFARTSTPISEEELQSFIRFFLEKNKKDGEIGFDSFVSGITKRDLLLRHPIGPKLATITDLAALLNSMNVAECVQHGFIVNGSHGSVLQKLKQASDRLSLIYVKKSNSETVCSFRYFEPTEPIATESLKIKDTPLGENPPKISSNAASRSNVNQEVRAAHKDPNLGLTPSLSTSASSSEKAKGYPSQSSSAPGGSPYAVASSVSKTEKAVDIKKESSNSHLPLTKKNSSSMLKHNSSVENSMLAEDAPTEKYSSSSVLGSPTSRTAAKFPTSATAPGGKVAPKIIATPSSTPVIIPLPETTKTSGVHVTFKPNEEKDPLISNASFRKRSNSPRSKVATTQIASVGGQKSSDIVSKMNARGLSHPVSNMVCTTQKSPTPAIDSSSVILDDTKATTKATKQHLLAPHSPRGTTSSSGTVSEGKLPKSCTTLSTLTVAKPKKDEKQLFTVAEKKTKKSSALDKLHPISGSGANDIEGTTFLPHPNRVDQFRNHRIKWPTLTEAFNFPEKGRDIPVQRLNGSCDLDLVLSNASHDHTLIRFRRIQGKTSDFHLAVAFISSFLESERQQANIDLLPQGESELM